VREKEGVGVNSQKYYVFLKGGKIVRERSENTRGREGGGSFILSLESFQKEKRGSEIDLWFFLKLLRERKGMGVQDRKKREEKDEGGGKLLYRDLL